MTDQRKHLIEPMSSTPFPIEQLPGTTAFVTTIDTAVPSEKENLIAPYNRTIKSKP